MHDETFLVTQGRMRFHLLSGQVIDASTGDYVTVPTRSPHTFSNPFDEEAKFFNTYTPAHYINYFKMLAKMSERGKPMDPEVNRRAMAVSLSFVLRAWGLGLTGCSILRLLVWRRRRCRRGRESEGEVGWCWEAEAIWSGT